MGLSGCRRAGPTVAISFESRKLLGGAILPWLVRCPAYAARDAFVRSPTCSASIALACRNRPSASLLATGTVASFAPRRRLTSNAHSLRRVRSPLWAGAAPPEHRGSRARVYRSPRFPIPNSFVRPPARTDEAPAPDKPTSDDRCRRPVATPPVDTIGPIPGIDRRRSHNGFSFDSRSMHLRSATSACIRAGCMHSRRNSPGAAPGPKRSRAPPASPPPDPEADPVLARNWFDKCLWQTHHRLSAPMHLLQRPMYGTKLHRGHRLADRLRVVDALVDFT